MIWFFERGPDTLQIETRFNNHSGTFELVWHHADGTRTLESFPTEGQFRERSEAVEAQLAQQQWRPTGSPEFMRDGWKVG